MTTPYLSSHEVATLLGVSPSAVLSWIDRGWLDAHRTPGGHRRVEKRALVTFLQARHMPVPGELGSGIRKLLIIDDEAAQLRAIQRLLGTLYPQLEIATSESAVDGLLKVGTFLPEVVLLDAYMPGMNGVEVCSCIRANPATAHIRVVALTGLPSPHLASAFLEAGAVACLIKPLDVEELARILDAVKPNEVTV